MIWPSRRTIFIPRPCQKQKKKKQKRYIIADKRQQMTPSKVHHQNVRKIQFTFQTQTGLTEIKREKIEPKPCLDSSLVSHVFSCSGSSAQAACTWSSLWRNLRGSWLCGPLLPALRARASVIRPPTRPTTPSAEAWAHYSTAAKRCSSMGQFR